MSNKSSSRVPHSHQKIAEAKQSNNMDIDNLMSDPAQPFTASQDQATESTNSNPGLWDAKVYREEVANIKPRLLDQKFNANDYTDPFKPHPPAQSAQNGDDDDDDVQRWQSIIDRMTEKA